MFNKMRYFDKISQFLIGVTFLCDIFSENFRTFVP